MSKERATFISGHASGSLWILAMMCFSMASMSMSMFTPRFAEIGMIGAFSAMVPLTNSLICL